MKKHWLYYVTPCTLAALFCIISIFNAFSKVIRSDGWSFMDVILLAPTLLFLLVANYIVKMVTDNPLYIWIIEGIIIAILIFGLMALW